MNRYKCMFYGRPIDSIGPARHIVRFVEAESPEQAKKKLYDDYEHISECTVRQVEATD